MAVVGCQLLSRWAGYPDLVRIARALWWRPAGRAALILAWAFVGWHFFSRATIPH